MKIISFLIFMILGYVLANAQVKDVNLKITGLSEEYANKFRSEKNVIIDYINDLDFPKSIFPVNVNVSYKDGEGWVTMTLNYVHVDLFSNNSVYTDHNDNLRELGIGKGISFLFIYRLLSILSEYKYRVARNGYFIDNDLAKFKSCIKLVDGANYVQIYAYNYLGDRDSGGVYPLNFYTNVDIKYDNKYYQVSTTNPTALNEIKFFYIGKTQGLDGSTTGDYYFSKFFKIDNWESLAKREEKRKSLEYQQNIEPIKTRQEEFEDEVRNGIGYIFSSKISNTNDIKLTIDTKAIPIIYDYIKQVKEKYPDGYKDKIETYEDNIKKAIQNGYKPEDYAMFDFDIFFNKDKSLEKIELGSILIKGVGMKNIEMPSSFYNKLKNYFEINTIPRVNLDGIDYPVNLKSILFFTIDEISSNKTIGFQVNKEYGVTFFEEPSESLSNFLKSNSKITGLEFGKYEAKLTILDLHFRLSHFLNFNKAEMIENTANEFIIISLNKL